MDIPADDKIKMPCTVVTPKDRLREHRRQRQAEEEALAAQQEYRCREALHRRLFQMGEANDWACALCLKTQYCIHRRSDDSLCCHMYEDGVFSRELSLELFERRYKVLRAKFEHASLRGSRLKDSGSSVNPNLAEGGERRELWFSDEQQTKRRAEIRAATTEVRRLASLLQMQAQAFENMQPALMPFAVVGHGAGP
jgi:hypothetical protein